jgi:cytoskeletal protein RodZ
MTKPDAPPTHPKNFGEELQRLRSSTGLTISDITAETKISRRLLEALESGNFQYLPERVFSRNFVRQYAKTIGCDENRLVEGFDSAWEQFQLESGTHPALMITEAPPRRSIRWRFWLPIVAGSLILLLALAVILTDARPDNDLLPDPRRPIRVQPVTPDNRGGRPITPGNVTARGKVSPEPDVITVIVKVDAGKECWIHYRDHEGMTDQRLLSGGEELSLELIGPVKFTVGNAGAATILVGSTEYRDLGIPGQVIHTEVSREGLIPLGTGLRYD